ncbi:MAG: hypothetical protein M3436_18590 [Pseudomonadota bacterium]|nr:hypothetical protein [Pseudomonadota bacterium]
MQAQLLYERWMHKPEWSLRAEGIPLLIGIAPGAWETLRASGACKTPENELWASVRESVVTEGKPRVINPEPPEQDWRCAPIDLYQWARASGVPIPEPFEALMQFIQRVVPGSSASSPDSLCREPNLPARNNAPSTREKVLGAALNVLAKCPDQCYDQHGLVSGEKITQVIAAQSIRWFDAEEPPMRTGEMADLIDKWLE